MFATMLNLSKTELKKTNLYDMYSIHKFIYDLFPDQNERDFLFVEKNFDFNERIFLIISQKPPKTPKIGRITVKQIQKSFFECSNFFFEILTNPVKKDSKTQKLIPIKGEIGLKQWFKEKTLNHGFEIILDNLQIKKNNVVKFTKKGQTCLFNSVTFSGKLKVTNRESFIRTIQTGIGKGKSFGFGLLQVCPLN